MKRFLQNLLVFPYALAMSGPVAVIGTVVSFVVGIILGALLF